MNHRLRIDTIYVLNDGAAYFTPDGTGRIFYDSLDECRDECGLTRVSNIDFTLDTLPD